MDKIPIKVLLVEDNPTDVILLREALGQDALNTFELTVVERLDSALTTVQENTFDIVLLDLGLPDSQGLETFNQIHQSVPEIPKVILSGLSDEALALQAVHAGAQDYEEKGKAGFASAARAIRYAVERQKAQAAVRASEERFRAMIENGLDDISLLDAKGNLIWESPSVVRNLGYAEHEFLQRSMFELIHPDDQAWTGALFAKLVNEPGTSQTGTFRLRHADGSWHWVEAVVTNLLGNPSVQAIVANYRDITDRKQAEETIRSLAKFPEENPNPVLRIGREGQIIYANHIANHLWLGAWGASLNDPLPEEWQVLVVDAYQRNTKQALDMSIQGHIYAISIVPFPEYGYTNVYGDDVTESRQADEKVRTAREFLQGIQNALSAHISILDADGNIVEVNSAWREFADQNGFEHSNYGIGSNYLDICDSAAGADGEEAPQTANAIREILAGKIEQAQIEYPCHSPSEQRWFMLRITSFKDGIQRFVVLAHENITERKLAENRIQESQTRLAEAQSIAKVGSWETDLTTLQVVWSDETYRIFELDTHTFGESHPAFLDFVHPEDSKKVDDAFNSSLENDAYTTIEHRIITARGNIKFVEERWRVEPDAQGRPVRAVGTCQDITERKRAETALLEREFQYRNLADSGLALIWTSGTDKLCNYFNEPWLKFTGRTMQQEMGNGWTEGVHPDDFDRCLQTYVAAFDKREAFDMEYRLRHVSGEYRWLQDLGTPNYNSAGEFVGYIGHCFDITERKLTEQKLLESELEFHSLAEAMPQIVWITRADGWNIYFNQQWVDYTGLTLEESYGNGWNKPFHPDDQQRARDAWQNATKNGDTYAIDCRLRRADGIYRWWLIRGVPVRDASGTILKWFGTCTDIHERKLAEEKLHASEERYRQLVDNFPNGTVTVYDRELQLTFVAGSDLIKFSAQPQDFLGKKFQELASPETFVIAEPFLRAAFLGQGGTYEAPHWDNRYYFVNVVPIHKADGQVDEIQVISQNITERKRAEEALRESEALYRQAMEVAGMVPYHQSYDADDKTPRYEFIGEGIRQITGYEPAEFNAQLWDALIEEVNLVEELKGYSLEEGIQLVRTGEIPIWKCEYHIRDKAGNTHWVYEAAVELYNERRISHGSIGTFQDITARKLAEEALRQSEKRYRTVVENQTEFIVRWTPDGTRTFVNDAYCRYYGMTPKQALATNFIQHIHADDRQVVEEKIARLISGVTNVETEIHRIIKPDGGIGWQEWTDQVIYDSNGQLIELQSIGRDITERKLAEDQLRKLSRAVEQNASTIVITDKAGNIEYVNSKFTETTGYTPEDAYGQNPRILKSGHTTQAEYERMWLAITTGKEWHGELQNRKKNGELYWESATISPIFDERGEITHFIAVKEDITERKQTENKLREANERFQQLADNIQEVFWITDAVTGKELYISPAGEKIWGCSLADLMQIPDIFINTVLPADRPMVLRALEEQRTGQPTEMEYRIVYPDGLVHWIWDRAFPIFDEAGHVTRVAGIAMDVTESKKIDDDLRARDALLREAQRIAQLGHYQLDIATGHWESSDILNAVFGIDNAYRKDMNGWAGLIHPTHRDEILAYFKTEVVEEHTPFDREYQIIRKDNGQTRWVHGLGQLEFDSTGHPVRLIGTVQDITARKQTEAEASRHLAELQALYENGLAVGRLLEPQKIGERIIATFEKHLAWHHVAVRLIKPESMEMELIAFNQAGLNDEANQDMQSNLNALISTVGQGLSGWVAQTGQPLRTGNVNAQTQYIATYQEINSGLYMPLKLGERCIGVISVESHEPDAFSEQDERLLATLANQAAIAFENARLYQVLQQELQERMRAEIALRTSETHYRELTDSITDVFFELDQNLCYTHWNKASELLTGIPEVSALGRSMHEVMGVSAEQTRIEKIYESVLLSQHPTTFETHLNFNNLVSDFEVNAYPSTRGVAVVAKDVTERKRSEIILRKRFELMEYAARHTLTEIMQKTIDEVSDLTGSNIGFFQTLQADQTSPGMQIWSTKTLSHFNVPVSEGQHQVVEHAGVWADAIRQRHAIVHNDYESLPNKKVLPTGHAPLLREIVIPIIRNENILAVMGIANKPEEYTQQDLEIAERFTDYAWDITERKQMELALAEERNQLALRVEERTADFSRANANLARALRVKDEFLANMSHELRTPLNAILGLSESLAEQTAGPLNEKQLRYITTVTESGHHLLSLINDILDLAKIEAGQITLDVNKVDIHSVCEASLRMIKQLARKKNQETLLKIDQSIGLMWADERRLKQMLVNLLSNAVKFTPNEGKLGLEVHGDREANKVTFTVWDTGIGIKEADLLRLFQPFVQLDSGLARESSGTGLGLALVAQMARLHGGSTSVVSELGKGSRFTIMLPWEPVLAVDTVERLKITGKFKPIKFSRERKPIILLVEDTEDVIMMISDYLELNGFKVYTARDGIEGVTQARLTHPDLILMDIQMPRMDGFEATQKLRSEPDFKKTPIIALTALAMPNDRERCLEAGMDEYITKPVHLRALVKLIENFLIGEQEVQPK